MDPNNVPGPEGARDTADPAEEMAAGASAGEGGFAPSLSDARSGEALPEGDARSTHVD